jgi:hypothetical protein
MLRNGTLSYWYGVLYMVVVRIDPSTYIITLFPYHMVQYGTGTVRYRYRNQLRYGTVRYLYGTVPVQ